MVSAPDSDKYRILELEELSEKCTRPTLGEYTVSNPRATGTGPCQGHQTVHGCASSASLCLSAGPKNFHLLIFRPLVSGYWMVQLLPNLLTSWKHQNLSHLLSVTARALLSHVNIPGEEALPSLPCPQDLWCAGVTLDSWPTRPNRHQSKVGQALDEESGDLALLLTRWKPLPRSAHLCSPSVQRGRWPGPEV